MNKNIKTLIVLIGSVVLSGCTDFYGKLNVTSSLTIKNHHFLNKTVTYTPGVYEADLRYHPHLGLLEIRSKGHKNIKFKIPKHYLDGKQQVDLKGANIGENFDIQGNYNRAVTDSDSFRCYQTCVIATVPQFGPHGEVTYIPVYGNQDFTCHNQTTTFTVDLNFNSTGNQAQLAQFDGSTSNTVTYYDTVLSGCHY